MLTLCRNFKKIKQQKYLMLLPTHKYPTQVVEVNFAYKKVSLNITKYSTSVREPKIWDEFSTKEEKDI